MLVSRAVRGLEHARARNSMKAFLDLLREWHGEQSKKRQTGQGFRKREQEDNIVAELRGLQMQKRVKVTTLRGQKEGTPVAGEKEKADIARRQNNCHH